MENISSYKTYNILARYHSNNYQIGIIQATARITSPIWLEKAKYNSIDEAKKSGREYAKVVINRLSYNKN